jgi:hypothetical protein
MMAEPRLAEPSPNVGMGCFDGDHFTASVGVDAR